MRKILVGTAAIFLAAGCTVHPAGERQERQAALAAGRPYEPPIDRRPKPALPDRPTVDDYVHYALVTNAGVERSYWKWRAALEQVVIDGTQPTNLAISGSLGIDRGHTSLGQATIAAGNDPMADIILPNKLDAAARRALETARAAGQRFHQAQLDVRLQVIDDYDDYALTAELVRLDRQNIQLLTTLAAVTQARAGVGTSGQRDVLKAQNELDLALNDAAAAEAQLPGERAALNAILNRPADAPLPEPLATPAPRSFRQDPSDRLNPLAASNPELSALTDETHARQAGIDVARLLNEPDISLTANTDLKGIAQTVSGMVTVPILKYEAIRAAVAQAEANLRAAEAGRRQMTFGLDARAIADLRAVGDDDRQIDLYEHSILPRATQIVTVTRTAYESGTASLLDVLDGQRALIEIRRLTVTLRTGRDKRFADLQSIRPDIELERSSGSRQRDLLGGPDDIAGGQRRVQR